jgi:hypothetical protein
VQRQLGIEQEAMRVALLEQPSLRVPRQPPWPIRDNQVGR